MKRHLPACLRRLKRLDRAAGPEDLIDLLLALDGVHLPEVDVIGLQEAERGRQVLLRFRRRALWVLVVRKTFFRTPCRPMP